MRATRANHTAAGTPLRSANARNSHLTTLRSVAPSLSPAKQHEGLVSTLLAGAHYEQMPWDALKGQNEDLYRMYRFFEDEGYQADIEALRRLYPGLHDFDSWLAEGSMDRFAKGEATQP